MKKRFFATLIAAVMAFSLTACQGLSSTDDKATDDGADSLSLPPKTLGTEGNDQADTSGGVLDDATAQELYNTYIDLNNAMTGRINDSLSRYFSYVDYSEEFQLLEENGNYYDCYDVSRAQRDMETAYEIVSGKSEKDALDQAFLDMYPSLSSLTEILNEISDYTDEKTFLEDGYAKSQEQHTALMGVLEEYFNTGDAFMMELSVVAAQQRMEDLELMKNEGYVVLYSLNMVIEYAQEIESALYYQDVWDDNILDMDLTEIQPLYDAFSSYVDAVLAYNEDSEALKAEGLNSASLAMFIMNMKGTRDSISKVLAKVEAGEPLGQFDTTITLAGQCNLASFEAGVSDMINSYNRLISY